MSSKQPEERLQLDVLDSVIYGAARAFDYLGERGQEMLDKVGDGIMDYLLKEGFLKKTVDPQQLMFEMVSFFKENGYVDGVEFTQQGETVTVKMKGWRFLSLMSRLRNQNCYLLTCPVCLASDSMMRANNQGWLRVKEKITPDGDYNLTYKPVPIAQANTVAPEPDMTSITTDYSTKPEIGKPVFETVEYGLACGFEFLGAQAQLLLDNVGQGVLEFLHEQFSMQFPDEPRSALKTLAEFYAEHGLADHIKIDWSASRIEVTFENYEYARVLKRLIEEGHYLASCPFTLAARSILRKAGFAVAGMTWSFRSSRNVTLTMPLRNVTHQEFDEDRVASLMDSA